MACAVNAARDFAVAVNRTRRVRRLSSSLRPSAVNLAMTAAALAPFSAVPSPR
ncbi:MAG TPA: hypothetical protein VLQ79_05385 [Myxococcaceae bacterium]|nr:hypothetical protein [Myxococcaceae bacterium]